MNNTTAQILIPAPKCECGQILGAYCHSDEPADVEILWVPESDRGSILAANNGADPISLEGIGQRLRLSQDCAALLCEEPWCVEVAS